jgi:hypothetical protein
LAFQQCFTIKYLNNWTFNLHLFTICLIWLYSTGYLNFHFDYFIKSIIINLIIFMAYFIFFG